MKTNYLSQYVLFFLAFVSLHVSAQLDLPRNSPQAEISQRIGTTDVTIKYSRPSVKGRELWGKLVPFGMNNLGFGTAKASPWRAGADENTVIKFSDAVSVEGKPLNAGEYGFHIIVNNDDTATLIFSNDSKAWGSYFYKPENDALRVAISTETVPHTEQLTYSFDSAEGNSAIVSLKWGEKAFPFKIEVDVPTIVLENIREDLNGQKGFVRQNWETAATYALNNGGDLNEALTWVDAAIAGQFFSQKTFSNLQTKSQILTKMGKIDAAEKNMKEALEYATIFQIHQYARTLIAQDRKDEALDIFKHNAKINKDQWPVNYGLARGYAALGDYKKALSYIEIALKNAPDAANRAQITTNIEKLRNGQDIN